MGRRPRPRKLTNDDWIFDPELESFRLKRPDAQLVFVVIGRIKQGWMNVTPGIMKSVARPDWKRELIEAICLAKVQPKEK